jgi:uncharacterized alkaline shock family protein YloU
MHNEESRTDLGTVKIHKNVIASIASLAALEIDGVKRLGGDFRSGLFEFLGHKSLVSIKVSIDKHDEVKLEIPLIIKYDANIPDISSRVQENVRQALERMTNLSIKDIDIVVQGIERGE